MNRATAIVVVLLGVSGMASATPLGGLLDSVTREQQYEARRSSSSNEDLTRNADARPIPPGESLVLADLEGPGVITHIWTTIAAEDPLNGRSVVIRIYYDGNEKPSVEAPLGDFFGVGHAATGVPNLISMPVQVTSHGRSRTCYWRMPFRERILITATNESPDKRVGSFYFYVDWQKHEELPEDTMYFHAQYRQEHPTGPGNFVILETEGRGHYVGTVYSAHQMETGWFGEGDDFFYIDGADYPQLAGTGTEDYFNDAWGLREFSAPFHGVSLYDGVFAGDRVTAYRWHLPDPVPFKKSLRLEMETKGSVFNDRSKTVNPLTFELGGFLERPDWVSSVAYWYQYPPVTFEEGLPPVDERVAPYRFIDAGTLPQRSDPPILRAPSSPGTVFIPRQKESWIEFDFEIEEAGRYQINAILLHGVMGNIFQPYLNGEKINTPLDLVIVNVDPIWVGLDLHDLEPGTHTLRFEATGERSPHKRTFSPDVYGFGLQYLVLLRLQDMEGYHRTSARLLNETE